MSARGHGRGSAQKGRSLSPQRRSLSPQRRSLSPPPSDSPQPSTSKPQPSGPVIGNRIDPASTLNATLARRCNDNTANGPANRAKVRDQIRVAPSLKRPALAVDKVGATVTSKKHAGHDNVPTETDASLQPRKRTSVHIQSYSSSAVPNEFGEIANHNLRSCARSPVRSMRVNPMKVDEVQGKGWSSGETATPPLCTPTSSISCAGSAVCSARMNPMKVDEVQGKGWPREKPPPHP